MKVAPGHLGLGGGIKTPNQYRQATAEYNARQMTNQFLAIENANQRAAQTQQPKPKKQGGCSGCGSK
jgi:hypothetical protein